MGQSSCLSVLSDYFKMTDRIWSFFSVTMPFFLSPYELPGVPSMVTESGPTSLSVPGKSRTDGSDPKANAGVCETVGPPRTF